MDNRVKKFIEENIELIEEDRWEELYEKASKVLDFQTGSFTETLLAANIHPERVVKELPEYFLYGCKLPGFKIPNHITRIGSYAFRDCESFTNIDIPDSVTAIDYSAFYGCEALQSITIPEGVVSIGNSAFSACINLTSIHIPSSVQKVGDHAFAYCSNLQTVTFGENSQLSSIGFAAFSDCTSLMSITIPESVTLIGLLAFSECGNLTNVAIRNNAVSIEDHAFEDCGDNLTINYSGTKDDWKKIYNLKAFQNTYFRVNCTDGTIVKRKR